MGKPRSNRGSGIWENRRVTEDLGFGVTEDLGFGVTEDLGFGSTEDLGFGPTWDLGATVVVKDLLKN